MTLLSTFTATINGTGSPLGIRAVFTPSVRLRHADTKEPLSPIVVGVSDYRQLVATLPRTGQAGLIDASGAAVRDWYWIAEVREWQGGGRSISYRKTFRKTDAGTLSLDSLGTVEEDKPATPSNFVRNDAESRRALLNSPEFAGLASAPYGGRWAFDGDSISIGGQTNISGIGQDRNATWTQMFAAYAMGAVDYVGNAAVAGQRLDQALARFDANVAPLLPNVVFLTIGTNDIGQSRAMDAYFADLEVYLGKVLDIGARLVLGSIPPTSNNVPAGRAAAVLTWNTALSKWAKARGIDVVPWERLADPATGGLAGGVDG